jgi:hypothetical protein
MRKRQLANNIVPPLRLRIGPSLFWCPFCSENWRRGGHKEGFVKSAASNHVAACFDIALWNAGYVPDAWLQTRGLTVKPRDEAHPRVRRAILALIRSRKKKGLTVSVPLHNLTRKMRAAQNSR